MLATTRQFESWSHGLSRFTVPQPAVPQHLYVPARASCCVTKYIEDVIISAKSAFLAVSFIVISVSFRIGIGVLVGTRVRATGRCALATAHRWSAIAALKAIHGHALRITAAVVGPRLALASGKAQICTRQNHRREQKSFRRVMLFHVLPYQALPSVPFTSSEGIPVASYFNCW